MKHTPSSKQEEKIHILPTWVPVSVCIIVEPAVLLMLSLPLDGLFIGLPVYCQYGGCALDLDIPSLGECLLLNLQPKTLKQ